MTTARHVLAVVLGVLLFLPAGLAFLVLMASVGLVTQVWGRPAVKAGEAAPPVKRTAPTWARGWGRLH